MTDVLITARQRTQEAFDLLWQPGPAQRTQSRERALYWLQVALRLDGADIASFDIETCRRAYRACTEAHGGRRI
jgi:hypothetical protein